MYVCHFVMIVVRSICFFIYLNYLFLFQSNIVSCDNAVVSKQTEVHVLKDKFKCLYPIASLSR